MQPKERILPLFVSFFILSFLVFLLSANNILLGTGFIGNALFPVVSAGYSLSRLPFSLRNSSPQNTVKLQNQDLEAKLIHLQQLQDDNKALRDQFETTVPTAPTLLPAKIIGMPSLLPGINAPEEMILDKGGRDGIRVGQVVIYKDNLLGMVKATADTASEIVLITNKASSFTAQTSQSNAQGVMKGLGNGQMILDNVVLSDTMQIGDSVVTKGDQTLTKNGVPPGLIVGKITSVDKNPSAIFQKANIKSLVDVTSLSEVFIVIQ